MKKLLPVLLLMVMLLCGGCWDWQILDDLSIIFGIGVDRAETEPGDDAEMFLFSFVNPVFDPDADEVRVVTAITGYSLRQSLFNLQLQSDQQPVLSKVNVMIFCEEAARDGGMHDIMLQMDQLRESNPDSWICIVRDATARQVLSLEVPQQPRPAVFLADVLNHNHANGRIPLVNAFRYWAEYNTPGVNPVVPVIELTGPPGEEPDGILLAGLAAIDDQGRMKGCLSDTETINYLLLTNGMRRGRFYTRVDYAGQKRLVTAFVQKNTLNITTSIVRDRPVVDIKAEIVLDSVNVDLQVKSILQEDLYRGLERALAGDFQGNMRRVLKKSQEWETDITGIGQHVRVQQPRWFREKEWSAVFGECQINVEVEVTIKRIGTVTNPDF